MPRCINYNSDTGTRPTYYTGRERTPLGSGLSPKYEPIGRTARGLDGRMYIVRYVGLNTKRWMYMWWLEDTQI
jgi:hypothetical protein